MYAGAVARGSNTEANVAEQDFGIWNMNERAKAFYEASRKSVGGRPPWSKLNPRDPYDAAMIEAAKQKVRNENGRL